MKTERRLNIGATLLANIAVMLYFLSPDLGLLLHSLGPIPSFVFILGTQLAVGFSAAYAFAYEVKA